ncbi:MAG: hypothetical protein ACREMO_12115 [Gemmatimonadales bacterium]
MRGRIRGAGILWSKMRPEMTLAGHPVVLEVLLGTLVGPHVRGWR